MRKGDEMKRFAIILLAVATALAMALPATAKKPVNPEPEPEPAATYMAEIAMLGTTGVETTCVGSIEVTRTDERQGAVTHFESTGARLDINAPGLAWDSMPIEGCLGTVKSPEYFRITFDGDNPEVAQVAMLWIFDVDVVEKPVVLKNGKVRYERTRTDFRMGGPYEGDDFAAWGYSEENGTITTTGTDTFVFVQYDSSRDPLMERLDNGGVQTFNLEITLTPVR